MSISVCSSRGSFTYPRSIVRHKVKRKITRFHIAATKVMPAKLIDGKNTAKIIREEIQSEIKSLNITPGLAVIKVGDRKDSETYVRNKIRACGEVGIQSFSTNLPDSTTNEELLKIVQDYNSRNEIDGILIQLPLPKHVNETQILDAVSIEKDVDGFHPMNIGLLTLKNRSPLFISCTPQACMELLSRYNVEISGKKAVVIGRSNIVGMPVSILLQHKDATVTVVHSRTPNGPEISREADIVIAACGVPEMITRDWIKEGAVIIDVGINAVDDPTSQKGYKLVGDVKFDEVAEIASLITPVPGGVGPMTIAMLLRNTLKSAKHKRALS